MKYYSLNDYLKREFGHKLYKLSLDGGFTCPNRDGLLGRGGCIFCLEGSGAFAGDKRLSITEQIEQGKNLVKAKLNADGTKAYIAYFQSYTGTYGEVELLREKYMEAVANPEVAIISIATRPDCLSAEILKLLGEINHIKPVWVELGLQTIHEKTATLIRRGYPLEVYDSAVESLKCIGIKVITHMIIGLPGETSDMMVETARYIGQSGAWGIKFQLLHVLEGTDLAWMYRNGEFEVLSLEEYTQIVIDCLRVIPEEMVVHRITGDGDKRNLIAPTWSGDKKRVLNYMRKAIEDA